MNDIDYFFLQKIIYINLMIFEELKNLHNINQVHFSKSVQENIKNRITNIKVGIEPNLSTLFLGCDNQIDRKLIKKHKSNNKIILFFDYQIISNRNKCKKNRLFLESNSNIKSYILFSLNNIIYFEDIEKYFNKDNDFLIYYSNTDYQLLFQRPQQIMRFMSNAYNKIFIGKIDKVIYEEKYNLLVVPYAFKYYVYNSISSNTITYYSDPRLFNEINRRKGKKIFDLIDAPIAEFEVWKPNLHKSVNNADYVMYSHPDLIRFLKEINETKEYHYISNACDYEHFSKAKEIIGTRPSEFPQTDKPILGYYGSFAKWLDYDIIRKYADEGKFHIVMIGGIPGNTKYNIRFNHQNITWLEHKPYEQLPYYLSWFDKCFLPFRDCEINKYVNPCKLWEYMASEKEIIKHNIFIDCENIEKYSDISFLFSKKKEIKKMNISIVLLAYNHIDLTKRCFQSLINTINNKFMVEVILVDNNSIDNTLEYFNNFVNNEELPFTFRIISNKKNLNFSGGMNSGIKVALGEYIILLNNDTICSPNWLENLYETYKKQLDKNKIGCMTPLTNFSGNESCIDLSTFEPEECFDKVKDFLNKMKGYWFPNTSVALFCGIIKKTILEEVNLLDEKYLNGWEDDDLYEKLVEKGYGVGVCLSSFIYHRGCASVGENQYTSVNPNLEYYQKKWGKKWITNYKTYNILFDKNNPKFLSKYRFRKYMPKDNLYKYLTTNYNFQQWHFEECGKILAVENRFRMDPIFYQKSHHLQNIKCLYKHLSQNGIVKGAIYYPNQILNALGLDKDFEYYKQIDKKTREFNLVVNIDNNLCIDLSAFCNSTLLNRSFEEWMEDITLMNQKDDLIKENDLLIVCFIGREDRGWELIDKILIFYERSEENKNFHLAITFKNKELYNKFNNIVKELFLSYSLFINKEFGSDIVPSLQVFYHFYSKNLSNFKYVFKLHSKSDKKYFNDCVDYILDKNMYELIYLFEENKDKSNTLGHTKYYLDLDKDPINCKDLVEKYIDFLDKNKSYIMTTNFMSNYKNFEKIINFMKMNNYKGYFLNNMYDSNLVNLYNSPIHFVERLFGLIKK